MNTILGVQAAQIKFSVDSWMVKSSELNFLVRGCRVKMN
jgi:hypothetical protein